MNVSNTSPSSPFHHFEQVLQARAGTREQMEAFGRKVIRPYMPEQHREFYRQLPYIVMGSVDEQGDTWASILAGPPGFVSSPSPTRLHIALDIAHGDPLEQALNMPDARLGLLGIELESRRRNRVNVHLEQVVNGVAELKVDQAFGNCPQYIQARSLSYRDEANTKRANKTEPVAEFSAFDAEAKALIAQADTFFVSSFLQADQSSAVGGVDLEGNGPEGVDVSHRGGMPGFIKLEGNTLTIPDFPGNYHFNTLGNLLANPKAGLVFPDFTTGDLLSLTGSTEILWEDHPEVQFFRGAQRAWRFHLKRGKWLRKALPFTAKFERYSLNSEMTGTWQEADARKAAEQLRSSWQPMTLLKVERESSLISSFYFKHANAQALLPFEAGQHVTFKVPAIRSANQSSKQPEKPLIRSYTLSSAPHDDSYRVSIKREAQGEVSRYMHDELKPGDVLEMKYPAGAFYLDTTSTRPAVLLAAGVGITPMISMAQHWLNEAVRTRHARELTIIHAAKDSQQRAFYQDFSQLEQAMAGKLRYLSVLSQPLAGDQPGEDYHAHGRIGAELLKQVLALDSYDFFVCGPAEFMQAMYDSLMELGVPDEHIFAEAFGPAAIARKVPLTRKTEGPSDASESLANTEEADQAVISFSQAQFELPWRKGDETILTLAESHGLSPESGCRNGACGACATTIKSGAVHYRSVPSALVAEDQALICCAVPAKGSDTLVLDL